GLEYVSHRLSGDHSNPIGSPHSFWSTSTVSPSSILWMRMRPALSEKAIIFESGDHWGSKKKASLPSVSCRGSPLPSDGRMHSSYSPDSSQKYAIHLPSGDHDGSRSATPSVRVRLRGLPFSAGSVHTSPRASATTRLPVDEIRMVVRLSDTSTSRDRSVG